MRYVAAYLLAVLGGNKNPSADDLAKILGSVGIDVDAARSAKVIGELKGKKIDDVIAAGQSKLASVPSGGGAPAAAAPAGAGPAADAPKGKKEEKKAESEEEEDEDMGFGLFD